MISKKNIIIKSNILNFPEFCIKNILYIDILIFSISFYKYILINNLIEIIFYS